MMYATYFADVLFVVKAVDNRSRTQEEHCFKKGMGTNMEEGQLGLVEADGYYHQA